MLPQKRWKILNKDERKPVLDAILENRNLTLAHFEPFRLSERLHDPYLLEDMKIAVELILAAMQARKKIAVFGDYDTDGIVSTSMLVRFFEKLNYPVLYFLPSRQIDGYGLKPAGVEQAKAAGVELLITVDNGISSFEAVTLANELGIDVIITDHHLQEGELPRARAVVNPNRKDSVYPFKGLCGAGVVFKLFQALARELMNEDEYKSFLLSQLDLVAMATVADIVPLRDENYALVKFGLKSLSDTRRPGIVELKRVSGLLGKDITTTSVGFYLSPRLNAAGRLGEAELGVKLLLSENREQAESFAKELNTLNSMRRKIQDQYIDEALAALKISTGAMHNIYIIESEEWDPGIIGIVSGKLKDKLSKPVIVFTRDSDGNYVGSARSTDNFHITRALTKFQYLFVNYGGHNKAAGLTISAENFAEFKSEMISHANSTTEADDFIPELEIDTVVPADQLNLALVEMIDKIGPFGEQNPEPVLALRGLYVKDIKIMGQGKHLKLFLQSGSFVFECVWWGRGDLKDEIKFGSTVDVACRPEQNIWNGSTRLQLVIEDITPGVSS